jgi:hypothetical protein
MRPVPAISSVFLLGCILCATELNAAAQNQNQNPSRNSSQLGNPQNAMPLPNGQMPQRQFPPFPGSSSWGAQHPMPPNFQRPQMVQPTITQPTPAPPAPSPTVENIAPAAALVSTPTLPPAQPAQVLYSQGSLTVIANCSSLNQILREISHATGIKITGSVHEDRVYGTYGPATPADVLASLLDGTGSNFVFSHVSAAGELTLTSRNGGATPSSAYPSTSFDNDDDSADTQQQETQQPDQDDSNPPPSDAPATPSATSNGTLTPQQVADRMAQMQQQRQQQSVPVQPQPQP